MKGKRSFLKHITAILLIAVLAFSFAACQKSNNNSSSGTDVTQDANHNFSYTETDNYLLSIFKKEKNNIFSPAVIAGFYLAKLTEIKAARIIIVCLKNNVDKDIIKQRLRELYV